MILKTFLETHYFQDNLKYSFKGDFKHSFSASLDHTFTQRCGLLNEKYLISWQEMLSYE